MLCGMTLLMSANALFAQSRGIQLEPVPVAQVATTPFSNGTYRALIIGNNNYRDGKGHWPPLKTAITDAKALEGILRNNYGFTDVQLLENATRRDVLYALQNLSRRVMANDSVLLYYAGHGFMDMETNTGYWVPVDAVGTDYTTFLRNSTIRDELNVISSRARHTLLISDSCFSGTLLRRGVRGVPPKSGSEKYYQKIARKKSVQIMTAGGLEYVDDDYRKSGHSPFTYFLLNELEDNDRPLLTLSELSTNVEKAVANNADQVPQSGVLQGAGDELGEFIFIRINVEVEGIPKDKVKVQVNVVPKKTGQPTSTTPARIYNEMRYVMPVPTL